MREDDADLLGGLAESDNVVRSGLVAAAVSYILLAVDEEVAMQLLGVVFGDEEGREPLVSRALSDGPIACRLSGHDPNSRHGRFGSAMPV